MGLDARKPFIGGLRTTKAQTSLRICADQPAHSHRLISAFVIRLLASMISKLASSEISIFWLVSVAKDTGLSLTLSETPDSFCRDEAQL